MNTTQHITVYSAAATLWTAHSIFFILFIIVFYWFVSLAIQQKCNHCIGSIALNELLMTGHYNQCGRKSCNVVSQHLAAVTISFRGGRFCICPTCIIIYNNEVSLTQTEVFRAFSSVVSEMTGQNWQRRGTAHILPKVVVNCVVLCTVCV